MSMSLVAPKTMAGDREAAGRMGLEGHNGRCFGRDFEADVVAMQVQFGGSSLCQTSSSDSPWVTRIVFSSRCTLRSLMTSSIRLTVPSSASALT